MQRLTLSYLLITLAACSSDSTGPEESRAPEPGRYAYEAKIPMPAGHLDYKFSGELVITRATGHSIAGYWEVTGFQEEFDTGFCDDAACVIYAKSVSWETFPHRISWSGGKTDCTLRVTGIDLNGRVQTHVGTCTLSRTD